MIKPLHIVLMGMQGSGKGTQGKLLAEHFGVPLLVTGDLYREEIKQGTDLGKKYESTVKHGELAPDHISKILVGRELAKKEYSNGVVIDGYPRTLQMAKDLEKMLNVDWVVYLKTSDEETIQRISNRRQCENGHVFNLVSYKPKREGICDYDSMPLVQREDDREEIIRNRLRIFHERTEPVIEYYRQQGKLIEIEACCTIEDISHKIFNALEAKIRARG